MTLRFAAIVAMSLLVKLVMLTMAETAPRVTRQAAGH